MSVSVHDVPHDLSCTLLDDRDGKYIAQESVEATRKTRGSSCRLLSYSMYGG